MSVPVYGQPAITTNETNPILISELETLSTYLTTLTSILTSLDKTKNKNVSKHDMEVLINKIQTDITGLCP